MARSGDLDEHFDATRVHNRIDYGVAGIPTRKHCLKRTEVAMKVTMTKRS